MFGFFSSNKRTALHVNQLHFDTTGWEEITARSTLSKWTRENPDLTMSLAIYHKKPDLPTIKDIARLRRFYRKLLGAQGGILEVELTKLNVANQMLPAVRALFKIPTEAQGVNYVSSLTLPFAKHSVVWKVQGLECGGEERREAQIMRQIQAKEAINFETEGWSTWLQDPYNPANKTGVVMNVAERTQFDVHFPNDVLSQVRAWTKRTEQTWQADAAFAEIQPFLY